MSTPTSPSIPNTMSTSPASPVPVITVDGPSGSGKGTISQLLARCLGFHMLDSGALYRLTALAGELHGVDMEDEQQLAVQATQLDVRFDTGANSTRIVLEGQDVTDRIREEKVSMNASRVAAYQPVREALLARQRAFRQAPGLVADGRDMGTQVFPEAEVKIFLTASAEERAQRRYKQLLEKGESVSFDAILVDIQARDERDTKRTASPLKPAADAQLLDSTALSIEEVLKAIMVTVEARLGLGESDV